MPDERISADLLQSSPLFQGLSPEDLARLQAMAEIRDVPAGTLLIAEGSPGDGMYLILDGEFEVTKRVGNGSVTLAVRRPGEFIGEQAMLDESPRSASVQALEHGRVVRISAIAFKALIDCSPSARLAILRTLTARLQSTGSLLMQSEKLAALGTLAAGLAHELNNPAAAIRRAAEHTRRSIADLERLTSELGALGVRPDEESPLHRLREEAIRRADNPISLNPIERSDAEEALEGWLREQGIDDAWEVASTLVGAGWRASDIEAALEQVPEAPPATLIRWLAVVTSVYGLLDETRLSAQSISEIVQAIKSYAYLDQAPINEIDLRESIENTLIILRHKLKSGIEVVRDFDDDLPQIDAHGSELTQVWTNLVDNAIQAMGNQGRIEISAHRRDDEQVVITITDNGPGIPPEIQHRIFDPFFTTKAPGQGTGLGLHIVYNIVEKHRGRIQVASEPGRTTFQVVLPIRLTGPASPDTAQTPNGS